MKSIGFFYGTILLVLCGGCMNHNDVPVASFSSFQPIFEVVVKDLVAVQSESKPGDLIILPANEAHDDHLITTLRGLSYVIKTAESPAEREGQPTTAIYLSTANVQISGDTAVCEGSYAKGTIAATFEYRLEKRSGKWVVIVATLKAIA